MNSLTLVRLAFWLVTAICNGIGGWVIYDNFRQHRWYKFEQQLKVEYTLLKLDGWPFFDGLGS